MPSTLQRPCPLSTLSPRIHQTNTPYPSIEPRSPPTSSPARNRTSLASAKLCTASADVVLDSPQLFLTQAVASPSSQ
ncbi:hypothetical protein PGTUg99_036125 [Puccinia graminis f. sp. tritici]|uniref:Uncharacterized protein n=1 Tax=Puccinia graminis f. sp. tritici TaxID=56615 RepID=A0A5B0RX26_PUCGR|nr:hypothetical protein PGTUg99_036125 [Puccinia graminis f. sp. tritici]